MDSINQIEALASRNAALTGTALLIDGRTEQDWLSFLPQFASLINFYDQDNNIHGNWSPFLLKDPVFLLASISKTPFQKLQALYVNTCNQLDGLLRTVNGTTSDEIGISFNSLFNQLIHIFMLIKRWVYFMQRSSEVYDLKTYVIYQTKTNYSKYLWAIVSLQQNLYYYKVPGIDPVDTSNFYFFDDYEEIIWKQNKDKSPYWDTLGLKDAVSKKGGPQLLNVYAALKKTGDQLFNFFYNIVQHAGTEFEKVKTLSGRYPDTILLRAFVNLLKNHQDQLNGITQKHLQFYYNDILKQTPKSSVPDTVFICAQLAKGIDVFELPTQTLFAAGTDKQQNPVFFNSASNFSLSQAQITTAYTLSFFSGQGFHLNNIVNPGLIAKDKYGKILSWDTFGGINDPQIPPPTELVIASPMLLLRGSYRTIILTLNTDDYENCNTIFSDAEYYFSGQNAWAKISNTTPVQQIPTPGLLQVTFVLLPNQPAIEPFLKNPDGLNSKWPMLKIVFNSVVQPSKPPQLTNLSIYVKVQELKASQLYNDFGALSIKAAFQPFGPTPLVKSNFLIGSDEVFSKPLTAPLTIQVDWDTPPLWGASYPCHKYYHCHKHKHCYRDKKCHDPLDYLSHYYKSYNDYLHRVANPEPMGQMIWDKFFAWLKRLFQGKRQTPIVQGLFKNKSFTIKPTLLQQGIWQPFYSPEKDEEIIVEIDKMPLFNINDGVLANSSTFKLSAEGYVADATIQNTNLQFTDTSKSGFLKFELSGPEYGFGSTLYPAVIADIALRNAWIIANQIPIPLLPPANLPFAPKVKDVLINYQATQYYDFANSVSEHPIECFFNSAFRYYKVYDNINGQTQYSYTAGNGMPLFQPFNNKGFLFLAVADLVPLSTLNLYVEISAANKSQGSPVNYYVAGSSAWVPLHLVTDSTNNLSCSGIIQLNIPADIADINPVMPVLPENNYWIAITVDDPEAFGKTTFLKTNGIQLLRSNETPLVTEFDQIPAGTISKLRVPIPQIADIVQPFPSFGGKSAESIVMMNERVSNRLKTKDRIVNHDDYFRLIRQEYGDIYFAKVHNHRPGYMHVYVVKAFDSWTDASAFAPLVSKCRTNEIEKFLKKRSSVFANIEVKNFSLKYVQLIAVVKIKTEYESEKIKAAVNHAFNIFLSPWITDSGTQSIINAPINNDEVLQLIKSIPGISAVDELLYLFDNESNTELDNNLSDSLFVPYINTGINPDDNIIIAQ